MGCCECIVSSNHFTDFLKLKTIEMVLTVEFKTPMINAINIYTLTRHNGSPVESLFGHQALFFSCDMKIQITVDFCPCSKLLLRFRVATI